MADRQTFAFGAGQPVQGGAGLSGRSRGAYLEGGQNQGGVGTARPTTFADPNDPAIPQFLQAAMEPYIRQKQMEKQAEGYDAVASGKAYDEIKKSDSGIASIFGPSYYHQGAAMYQANTSVTDVNRGLLEDPDLYKLGDADRSHEISKRYQSILTGDPTADTIIQQKMLETRYAVTNTLAKKNYDYGQAQGVQASSASAASEASAYQHIMSTQSELSAPTDTDRSAQNRATASFLAAFQQPHGMSDDSYKRFLVNSARNMIAQGNLWGFNALKAKGLLQSGGPLTDDQIAGLETAHDRAASRAMGDFAAFDPKFIAMKAGLHADIAAGRIKAPIEASKRLDEINSYVMGKTGSDVPMFDAGAVTNVADAVTDSAVAAARRAEERQWQLEDRQAGWDHEAKVKADEQSARIAQAGSFWGQGDVSLGLATGVMKSEDANLFATKSWTGGDMGSLARAFVGTKAGGGYVSDPVAKMAQSQIEAAGGKYTPAFDTGYRKWKALDQANPGAAAAYYGKYAVMLKKYDGLLTENVPPVMAYERSFTTPEQYDLGSIPPDQRKAFKAEIDNAVDSMSQSVLHPSQWHNWTLAQSSNETIKAALGSEAVQYAAHTGMSPEAIVRTTLPKILASNKLEVVGRFAWTNDAGTPPLSRLLGIPADVAGNTVMTVADRKLKAAGYNQGAYGDDYYMHRIPTRNDKAALYIVAANTDGTGDKVVLISQDELANEIKLGASSQVRGNQPKPTIPKSTAVFPTMYIDSAHIEQRRESYRHAMDHK